jgi:hypothetical protein
MMSRPPETRSAVQEALARSAYERDEVRIQNWSASGHDWLVTTHRGVFAVAPDRVTPLIHGWFFGICRHGGHLYAFENCAHRNRELKLGRIFRFEFSHDELSAARIIVKGLHASCHQIAVIDDLLHVVDTANQAILRFTLDGEPVDVQRPFPVAPPTDQSAAYLHINTIAQVGGRIGLVLHNGTALPEKCSEVAWFDDRWRLEERYPLPGRGCHDIVEDNSGRLWHSLSLEGEILRSDGMRVAITPDKMTRGIALAEDRIAVGASTFGPRHLRGTLNGSVVVLDKETLVRCHELELPAAPADIIAL